MEPMAQNSHVLQHSSLAVGFWEDNDMEHQVGIFIETFYHERLIIVEGTAGWKALAEAILGDIDPLLGNKPDLLGASARHSGIIEVDESSQDIVSAAALERAVHRLTTLTSSHPNP
jgi:hypothetical protein